VTSLSLIPFTDQVNGVTPLNGDALDGTVRTRAPASGNSVMMDITRLHPHPDNARKSIGDVTEMAESIRQVGILQPVTVSPHPDKAGHYYINAGHRRHAAAQLAGLRQVPVIIRQNAIGTASALQMMLIENCQRADLDPIEKADAMGRLRNEEGWSAKKIARAIGMTDATVYNYLALLELDDKTKRKVAARQLGVFDALKAVRKARALRAVSTGHADHRESMAATWEPDHFTAQHPLARKARLLCDAREHNNRRRLGKVACGQCFESVIREDERLVAAIQLPQ
jgi:ParB family chromosome partitioning protein